MKKYLPLLRRTTNHGFSLIELLVVVALIAIIASLAGINASFLQRMIVRSELEQLYITCAMMQKSAQMLNEPQTLFFDPDDNTYRYKKSIHHLAHQVCFGVKPNVKGPPSTPTHAISKPITFEENKITFLPDGIIQSGTIYLIDRNKRYMYALSCGVGHVSYLRKYQYTDTWTII